MENNWTELEIDRLPPDILTGNYEWQYRQGAVVPKWRKATTEDPINILQVYMAAEENEFRYRKPEPELPTHEEIMTKWWKDTNNLWIKISKYCSGDERPYCNQGGWYDSSWFMNRESADIPPEA